MFANSPSIPNYPQTHGRSSLLSLPGVGIISVSHHAQLDLWCSHKGQKWTILGDSWVDKHEQDLMIYVLESVLTKHIILYAD